MFRNSRRVSHVLRESRSLAKNSWQPSRTSSPLRRTPLARPVTLKGSGRRCVFTALRRPCERSPSSLITRFFHGNAAIVELEKHFVVQVFPRAAAWCGRWAPVGYARALGVGFQHTRNLCFARSNGLPSIRLKHSDMPASLGRLSRCLRWLFSMTRSLSHAAVVGAVVRDKISAACGSVCPPRGMPIPPLTTRRPNVVSSYRWCGGVTVDHPVSNASPHLSTPSPSPSR